MLQPYSTNSNYLSVVRALREMHRLSTLGLFESPEAEEIRDAMDEPWLALSDIEQERLRGLSADLNALEEETSNGHSAAEGDSTAAIVEQVNAAQERGEWDTALELLRQQNKQIPPKLASKLRGTVWQRIGDPETAAIFFEHAMRVESNNAMLI